MFGLGVGPTPVELTWSGSAARLRLDGSEDAGGARPRVAGRRHPARRSARRPSTLDRATGLPIEEISCGVPFIYVPLASRAAVDAAEPDLRALRALRSAFPGGHNAVFMFAVEPAGSDVTVYSRMFAPGLGVAEDPATGGASGPLGCYLVAHDLVPRRGWTRHGQPAGREDGAPEPHSHAHHREQPEAITRVQVGGQAVKVGSGVLEF